MPTYVTKDDRRPIGIFDSGVGGLSICHAIKDALPFEDLIYFADTAFNPYGNKPKDLIAERSEKIFQFMVERGCKAIVIACNTATTNSIRGLREKYSMPIIGVEPAIKPAAETSKSGVIAVLATAKTLESDSYKSLHKKHSKSVIIKTKACPEFVSLVEGLNHENEEAHRVVDKYVRPLIAAGSDKIVLGCTHFPFLKSAIQKTVGSKAEIIDTATPVAKQLKRKLREHRLQTSCSDSGISEFWCSGSPSQTQHIVNHLWHHKIELRQIDL